MLHATRQDKADAPIYGGTRVDRAGLARPRILDGSGGIILEGYAAVPGILEYRLPGGGVRRELVPESTLRRSAHLLRRLPVTLEHPPQPINPSNAKEYTIGDVGSDSDAEYRDGEGAFVRLVVRDAEAQRKIREGGVQGLSPRYDVKVDPTPGTHPEFGDFDATQIERYNFNHLAVVRDARGGHNAGVRIDSAGEAHLPDHSDASREDSSVYYPILFELLCLLSVGPAEAEILAKQDNPSAALQRLDAEIKALQAAHAESRREDSEARDAIEAQIAEKESEIETLRAKVAEMDGSSEDMDDPDREDMDEEMETPEEREDAMIAYADARLQLKDTADRLQIEIPTREDGRAPSNVEIERALAGHALRSRGEDPASEDNATRLDSADFRAGLLYSLDASAASTDKRYDPLRVDSKPGDGPREDATDDDSIAWASADPWAAAHSNPSSAAK